MTDTHSPTSRPPMTDEYAHIRCHNCGRFLSPTDKNSKHHFQPDAWGPLPGFDYKEECWWEHRECPPANRKVMQ